MIQFVDNLYWAQAGANPSLSSDGRFVAYSSGGQIYVYDRTNAAIELVSKDNAGNLGDYESANPSISADGRYVAYQSNLASIDFYDTNNAVDVFVYDRITAKSRRVSLDNDGNEGAANLESTNPAISGDGRYVAFESQVNTFVPSDDNGVNDIFLKALATGEVRLLSASASALVTVTTLPGEAVAAPALAISTHVNTPQAHVGDTITYTYRITNTGNVTLTTVSAVDDKLGAVSLFLVMQLR